MENGYDFSELEMMTPFERDVYIKLLITRLKKKAEEKNNQH